MRENDSGFSNAVEVVIELMKKAHANGQRPNIDVILKQYSIEATPKLFVELLSYEVDANRNEGMALGIGHYQKRYPNRRKEIETVVSSVLSKTQVQQLGPYEYRETNRIGSGAFAVVYRGRHKELDREVAIKKLKSGNRELKARLKREARILAALSHDNIVEVYDCIEQDNRLFVIMEFADGMTLAEELRIGTFSDDKAVSIAYQMADALAAAHNKGVVHRDIKPGNVIMTATRRVKIVDFGLARTIIGEENMTGDGVIMGTEPYMSPEQLEGDSKQISTATDVYALGVTMYEMLTGHHPFEVSGPELFDAIRSRPPVSPRELRPEIEENLADLCLRCLAKNPNDRPRAADVARSLRDRVRLPNHSSAETVGVGGEQHTNGRAQFWFTTLVSVFVIGFVVFLIVLTQPKPESPPASAEQPDQTPEQVRLDEEVWVEGGSDVHDTTIDLSKVRSIADSQRPVVIAIPPSTPGIVRDVISSRLVKALEESQYNPVTAFKPEFYTTGMFDQIWIGDTTMLADLRSIEPRFRDVVLVKIELDTSVESSFEGFRTVRGSLSALWVENEMTKFSGTSTQSGAGVDDRTAQVACTEKLAEDICNQMNNQD